jgi:hypothetical protein
MKRSAGSGTLVLFPGSSRSSRSGPFAGTGEFADSAPFAGTGRIEREPIQQEWPPAALGPHAVVGPDAVGRHTVAADPAERKARLDEQLARHAALERMLAEFVAQHDDGLTADPHAMRKGSVERAPSRERQR